VNSLKKTVIAQSKEHIELMEVGWKPTFAYQVFDHKVNRNKQGELLGNDLKEVSKLMVVMEQQP